MTRRTFTAKQTELLGHMWSCYFARSMTLGDFARGTVSSLEAKGLIAWADIHTGPLPFYGLTREGFAVCEHLFGPRKKSGET